MKPSSLLKNRPNGLQHRWLCLSLTAALLATSASALIAEPATASSTKSYGSVGSLTKSPARAAAKDIKPASKTLKNGLDALDKDRFSQALAARKALRAGTLERKVMAWAIAVYAEGVDPMVLNGIANDLPDWPGELAMRRNIERSIVKTAEPQALKVAFSQARPETTEAAIALGKAHMKAGNTSAAVAIVTPIWRGSTLSGREEKTILSHFGKHLSREDHRVRVEYLLSKKRVRGAQRIAARAGQADLVAARAAVVRKRSNAGKLLDKVSRGQQGSVSYAISKSIYLRNRDRLTAASKALLAVSPSRAATVSTDQLWKEQRIIAAKLLEAGKAKAAYRLASRNVAASKRGRIDAEFFAGWIALSKLGAAKSATTHFTKLIELAGTPLSKSRGHYWLGRALEKRGLAQKAADHFAAAARLDTTFYGQLAASKLGRKKLSVSRARASAQDRARFNQYELVQAIQKLESAGHPRKARMFYRFLARHMKNKGELALLAARAERRGDYQLSLQVGKTAFLRGFEVDNLAWPLGAIPRNTKTSGAGLPLAYAIARQESTFQVDARSPANALGLLQLLPTTAKRTARSLGIGYSRSRLVRDASYNARLGTAYLAQQMDRFSGSFILTFAAYNAGPLRAEEWIERFGDPRGKSLERVIDWIESIPYSETRNYVQRVMENYQIYKTRLKGGSLTIERDLRKG